MTTMPRKSSGPAKRDMFGTAHGQNGKGDADRTFDRSIYNANFELIQFPRSNEGFVKHGPGRFRKTY